MTTCNACGKPKRDQKYKACEKCREGWRLDKGLSYQKKTVSILDLEEKLREAYANGYREGRRSAFSVNQAYGQVYQIDDSLLQVNVRLSESIFGIEVMRKRFGHWEILQGITEAELAKRERDSIRTEFEVRARLQEAGIELTPSTYDGDGGVANFPTIKVGTNT